MDDDIRTWEAEDETSQPSEAVIMLQTINSNVPTPETEAEEI